MDKRYDLLIELCHRKNIEVSQNFAVKLVGSKGRLKLLIENGRVRVRKTGKAQNAMNRCKAEDVLRYAKLK